MMQAVEKISQTKDFSSEVWRSYDSNEINTLINHPEINKNKVDLDAATTIENNVWLLGHGFSSFLINQNDGSYEVHISVVPEQRGKVAFSQARKAIDYMFSKTDCKRIIGIIPIANKAAIKFGKMIGFKSEGIKFHEYMRGGVMECEKLILTKDCN